MSTPGAHAATVARLSTQDLEAETHHLNNVQTARADAEVTLPFSFLCLKPSRLIAGLCAGGTG